MLSSLLVPVFLIALTAVWYGVILALNALSKRRAHEGTDLRD